MSKHDKLRGVLAPIVTPCDLHEHIDFPRLEAMAERLLQAPIQGLYINGGTGDGSKLTISERLATAELLVPLMKKADYATIVHVGQTLQREACSLAEHAGKLGADAIASIPPRAGWDEILLYYKALASCGMPTVVYYIPGVTGMSATVSQLSSLLDIPGVIGIKVSDWNIFMIRCLKQQFPEKLVYTGLDEMLVPGLLYGADGTIGTWINLLPQMYGKVWTLLQQGKVEALMDIQQSYTEFLTLGWQYGILNAFQELMLAKGYATKCFRDPSAWIPGTMNEALKQEMLTRIQALNNI